MSGLGVRAGESAITSHGVGGDPAESAGLAETAAFGDMLQDRLNLLVRQASVEERRPLAFGEAVFADPAAEDAFGLVGPMTMRHGEISSPPLAVLRAVVIEATEAGKVIRNEDLMKRSAAEESDA